jgi:hypothetical protein
MRLFLLFQLFSALQAIHAATVAPTSNFTSLTTVQTGAILKVTINNTESDVNLLSTRVIFELDQLVTSLHNNTSIKVILFESGNTKFFAAHSDIIPRPGKPFKYFF